MPYSRPKIPYANVPLPYSTRYQDLENLSPNTPPSGAMLDGDFDYLIDTNNALAQLIADIVAGNIPGSEDPNNAGKLTTTDGEGNISWIFVDTDQLAPQAVTQDKLGIGSVGGPQLQDGSIPNSKLGPQCVNTGNYALYSIGTNQIKDKAITGPKIGDNEVQTNNYAPLSIPQGALQTPCVGSGNIQNEAITTPLVLDGAITLEKLAAAIQAALVPTGTILPYGGQSAPGNYLFADGSNVSRVTYAPLFSVYGTAFGEGDGATTFGLPDMRGVMGAGSVNNDTNGRITTATATTTAIGGQGGLQLNTLTTSQLPNFSLIYNTLTFTTAGATGGVDINAIRNPTPDPQNTSSIGGGQSVNNMPPFLLINYIIKT